MKNNNGALRFEIDGAYNAFLEDNRALFLTGYEKEKPRKFNPPI